MFYRPHGKSYIIHYTSYIIHIPCLTMSKSTCKWGCFPFADAKIEPFFQTLVLSIEGKNPKWNEWNEKVIFSGTSGIIFFSIPSPIRSTGGKLPGLRPRIALPSLCSFPFFARHSFSIRSPLSGSSIRPTYGLPPSRIAGWRISG